MSRPNHQAPTSLPPKQYARWLHESAGLPWDESCRMAGWSPADEYKRSAKTFCAFAAVFALVVLVLWFVPKAIAEEQPQMTEKALINCLNGRGMVIGNELWICTNTGIGL